MSQKEDLSWYEKTAADVRKRLLLRVGPSVTEPAVPPSENHEWLPERQKLSLAERVWREAASLGYGFTDDATNPIAELRRFDVQQLLIWHAQRSIDDFWGDVVKQGTEKPFFALAATEYLETAKIVHDEIPTAVSDKISGLNKLLAERLQAKSEPMRIGAESDLALDPEKPIDVTLTIDANPKAKYYPAGFSALFLRDPRDKAGRLTDAQFDRNSFVDMATVGPVI